MVEAVSGRASEMAAESPAMLEDAFARFLPQAEPLQQAQAVPLPAPWIGPMIRPLPAPGVRPYPPLPLTPDLGRPDQDPRFNDCRRAAQGSEQDWERFCRELPADPDQPYRNRSCWEQAYKSPQEKLNWCYNYFGNGRDLLAGSGLACSATPMP